MMNRIQELFERKDRNILSVYFTAGFPHLSDTAAIIHSLSDAGADLIEIGMPYSDPVADGPVIQRSNGIALQNGMSIHLLFKQLKELRKTAKRISPLILMGYLNPVLQFGFERFCKKASETGISGLILPDLPVREFEKEYKTISDKYHLKFIFLVTPETSEERIREIDELSDAFIYAVSSSSVTGRITSEEKKESYFKRIAGMKLKNPVLAGFGVHDRVSFELPCRYLNGAIIGTAFIRKLEKSRSVKKAAAEFVKLYLG